MIGYIWIWKIWTDSIHMLTWLCIIMCVCTYSSCMFTYVLLCIILDGHWEVWCSVERTGNADCNVSGGWVVQHVAIHFVNIAIYVRYCLKTILLSLTLYHSFSVWIDWVTSCNLHKFSQFCALFSMVIIFKHRAQKHSDFTQAATGYSVGSNGAHLIECEWEQHCFWAVPYYMLYVHTMYVCIVWM